MGNALDHSDLIFGIVCLSVALAWLAIEAIIRLRRGRA